MDSTVASVGITSGWQKVVAKLAVGFVGWKYLDGKYNISADFAFLPKLGTLLALKKFLTEAGAGVPRAWYQTLRQSGQAEKVMFISADDGRQCTFKEVEDLSNRVAHWAVRTGLRPGDAVAIMMDNCPEYVPLWLGLSKVRVVGALINTNIKGKPLVHAITTAGCKAAIFDPRYAEVGAAMLDELRQGGVTTIASFCVGEHAKEPPPPFCDMSLNESLATLPSSPVDEESWMSSSAGDPCCYIYTSGTTGLPKACKISHARLLNMGMLCTLFEADKNDIIYGSGLPMYHSSSMIGVMHLIQSGSTYICRRKFSASHHWEDCRKHSATVMQYIGELCRYLLAVTDKGPSEQQHCLRIAIGNGLRPEIWDDFQRRFNIPEVGEFYGATESNFASMNHCKNFQGQGAVGRAGPIALKFKPMKIVKFDVEQEAPVRDIRTGFCVECGPNEAGELIAPIRKVQTASGEMDDFEGYTSKEATDKKILRDAFQKGDSYFRTGDLIRRDTKGYFYFVDRIGDTFRWKGENVSTMEVSEVLSSFPGIVDANVYGVQVPNKEGRACMAALTMEPGASLNPTRFATHCRANLPPYAVPLFVRLLAEQINLTGTFKHQKVEYRKEGCNPSKIQDDMWWFNMSSGTYEPYGPAQYAEIAGGRARL